MSPEGLAARDACRSQASADGPSSQSVRFTMYHVTEWGTGKIRRSLKKLRQAKKWCRGAGHTGEDHPFLTGYPPRCYDAGEIVYNPRFSKRFGSAVGGLIDAQPPDHF